MLLRANTPARPRQDKSQNINDGGGEVHCRVACATCHALITLLMAYRFDSMYINIAQQIGGIEPLLDSFFGFLRRKTDFLNGAATESMAQETVTKALKKNLDRYKEDTKEKRPRIVQFAAGTKGGPSMPMAGAGADGAPAG